MKKFNVFLIANILILIVSGIVDSPVVNAQIWAHFGGNIEMTSYAAGETAISPSTVSQMTKLWGIGCDDGYFSVFSRSPAVWNDRLYAVGAGGPIECYDARSGTLRWTYGGTMTGWCPQPTVTSSGTVLYLQGDSTNYSLKAINGLTGALIWTAPLQFNLGFNDTAVVCLDEPRNQVLMLENPFEPDSGKLYAINLDNGQVNWYMSKALNGFSFVGDYLVRDGTTVYTGIVQDGSWSRERIGVVDLLTQQLVDTLTRPGETSDTHIISMTLCGDSLAVTFSEGYDEVTELVVYDTTDGSTLWSFTSPHVISGGTACNPVINRLYLPTNPRLYAFDLDQTPGDVQPAWTYTGFDEIYTPSVANGVVFFLSDTNAYALNETTGAFIRSFPLGETAYETTQVAVCDGIAYFSGNGGTCDLFAYGIKQPCDTLGVSLYMPAHDFEWPDTCSCSVTVCNPETTPYHGIPLFVILDVYGMLFFAPGFSSTPEWYTLDLPPDETVVPVLPEFTWPPATGEADGIIWYAAMTDQTMTALWGTMDTWTFGWH
ncbi:PQQ-binding-like beta-propeller repeat protein [bacterium]|nr:PQQ-binding-like beta-propeller repeat protein [candidate division CSSED10-310 bacterium]